MGQLPMCNAAPAPGTPVGVVMHRRGAHWVGRKSKVKAIINHSPIDGRAGTGAIVILEDGSWEFYWNLTELK